MTPVSPCSVRSALCVVIASLALAGCNALLGIEEYRPGTPDGGLPIDGMPIDGMSIDGMSIDGMPIDGMPIDGMPTELYLGNRDDLGGMTMLSPEILFAVEVTEITVPQSYTLDRLGFLSRSAPGATMKLGLYAEDTIVPGRPGDLVAEAPLVTVQEGYVEGDVDDAPLGPGRYWFAMVSSAEVALGSGASQVTYHYVNWLDPALPTTFPGADTQVGSELNVYLVVKP